MARYDIIGNIVIVKYKRGVKVSEKKKWALAFLKEHKNVRTVLEKSERFKGRLRIQKTRFIAGERTKEALYRENNCVFRLNVDSCYFSPRLASERKGIAEMCKKGGRVLVMFGGVAVYGIVIAKLSKCREVVSVEIGKECNKYAKENVKRNKVEDKVEIVQGDVRGVIGKGRKIDKGFDRIVMPRPNLIDSFLDVAFSVVKKGGIIHYYGFYEEKDVGEIKEMINKEAKKFGKKIRILKIKKAGEIGVRKYRYRADVKVLI